jgi:hypothetical protein
VVHLGRPPAEAEDVLDAAERLAQAARQMRSRAAMADPATGEAVPVEQASVADRPAKPPPAAAGAGRRLASS